MAARTKGRLAQGPDRWSYQDLVGLDFGSSGLKAVRVHVSHGKLHGVHADVLPAAPLDGAEDTPFTLPEAFRAKYAACASCTDKTLLRLLNAPANLNVGLEAIGPYLKDQFGLASGFRFGAMRLNTTRDARLVAVAMPESDIAILLHRFTSGSPAPCSLEVSGLAALNAFLRSEPATAGETVCLVDTGARSSFISFVHRGEVAMVRKADTGGDIVVEAVMRRMEVDRDTALAIVSGQSIDISQVMTEVLDYTFRQITLARDYVEREMNTRVSRLYLSGGLSLNSYWRSAMAELFGISVTDWNPLALVTPPASGWAPGVMEQGRRFAAAVGACLGMVREE
jgi:hypothetical protein